MAQFPDTPNFTGFNTPSRIEADIENLDCDGEIPKEIDGAFFRVQPDPHFPPMLGDDIAFNGDGMISRFHIHDGQCDFRQRWAKTDKWKAEEAAGRGLFGMYRNPLTDDASVKGMIRSTANTNAWVYAGKLWAMKEDSPALLMDPATMETEAFETWQGKMNSQTFTAHPKIDPKSGNMVAIGYAASGLCTDDVAYMEVSPDGELVREKWFKVPYYCMMHDFGITENYLVLHIVPSIGSWERLEARKPHFGFDTTMPVYLGVIPRRDDLKDEDIRWFKRGNCFGSHVVNAWEDGTRIHFLIPESKNNFFPFFPDVHDAPFKPEESVTHITDWVVDLSSNDDEFAEINRLTETFSEFPRIDDRFTGQKNRYTWGLEVDFKRPIEAVGGSAGGAPMNCLFLKDLETGDEQHWWAGPTSTLQEPCFIPRSADAPEGDGWIVQLCNRLDQHRSDLLIFDALEIEKGPVATVHIPIRLRFGLHGNFARSEDIGLKVPEMA